tara:strand:+ start:5644 stop:5850 length:207 start_codon:yes stop_codon:yes gene_type:complete
MNRPTITIEETRGVAGTDYTFRIDAAVLLEFYDADYESTDGFGAKAMLEALEEKGVLTIAKAKEIINK